MARSAGPEALGSKAEHCPVSILEVLAWLSDPHSSLGLELCLGPASGGGISSIRQRSRKGFSCFSALQSKVLVEAKGT